MLLSNTALRSSVVRRTGRRWRRRRQGGRAGRARWRVSTVSSASWSGTGKQPSSNIAQFCVSIKRPPRLPDQSDSGVRPAALVSVEKTADKLENMLDEDKSKLETTSKAVDKPELEKVCAVTSPAPAAPAAPAPATVEPGVAAGGGVENAGFMPDEPVVRIIPPTQHNTLDMKEERGQGLLRKQEGDEKQKEGAGQQQGGAMEKGESGSKQSTATTSVSTTATISAAPTTIPATTSSSSSRAASPSAGRTRRSAGPASKEGEQQQAAEEEIAFDPEGKSAVSGQRRTGWI